MTDTVHTVAELRRALAPWRGDGVALVPTMGALHEGHLSLVRLAREHARHVVVSIFVNPAQFAPHEDFDAYPRSLEADREKLGALASLVFAPSVGEIYPQGYATTVTVAGPSQGLESAFRPHFFAGVATVVAKLLIAALPDVAVFGEKDYQQLLVVKRLAADLGLPTRIVAGPIMREADGLAMSSRNVYLSAAERIVAGQLNRILCEAAATARQGTPPGEVESRAADALRKAGFDAIDYVAIRDSDTLDTVQSLERPARILAAAKIGRTRLIDNMAI